MGHSEALGGPQVARGTQV